MVRRRRGDGGCIWWLRRGWVGICAWWWEGIWARWRGWAGESSRCEDPAPTVGIGGHTVARYAVPARVGGRLAVLGNPDFSISENLPTLAR